MDADLDLSVVVGFRDWGEERLRRSVESILASFGELPAEVIVSDYGSQDPAPAERVAESTDARLVRTEETTVWSRSKALNAGFAQSRGNLLISTDADMLFSPQAMNRIHHLWRQAPNSALFLQCRDLPEDVTNEVLGGEDADWIRIERAGRFRPRWGMGGMMAISRTGYAALRGFDERLHTYGREDMDFALRARRAGYRTHWVEDTNVRMYHLWHAPTSPSATDSPAIRAALNENRRIVDHDSTAARNVVTWTHRLPDAPPMAAVLIPTVSDSQMAVDSALSVLAQSVDDIQLIIGAGVHKAAIRDALGELRDDRTVVVNSVTEALAAVKALFVAGLRAGDVLHPKHLEKLLTAVEEGSAGARGTSVGFAARARPTDEAPSTRLVGPIHGEGTGTWIVRADQFSLLEDQYLSEGESPRVLDDIRRLGGTICDVDTPVLLSNLSDDDPDRDRPAAEKLKWLEAFLPDKFVSRTASVFGPVEVLIAESFDGTVRRSVIHRNGTKTSSVCTIQNASYRDLVRIRQAGCTFGAKAPALEEEFDATPRWWVFLEIETMLRDGLIEQEALAGLIVCRGAELTGHQGEVRLARQDEESCVEAVVVPVRAHELWADVLDQLGDRVAAVLAPDGWEEAL